MSHALATPTQVSEVFPNKGHLMAGTWKQGQHVEVAVSTRAERAQS